MERYIMVFLAFGLLLSAGCVTPEEEPITKEELEGEIGEVPETPPSGLIGVSGDENLSVVKIKAFNTGTKWQFPVEEFEDEFIEAGLHSDSFIKLNNSHIQYLDGEEAIWIHPMIHSGDRAVLFNAVYSREIADCGDDTIMILGKEYEMAKLKDGASFEFDDKWKISLVQEEACTNRIVIYLDGYFYDISNDEQIALFRNDNTVLFKFDNIETEPYVEIIGTRPPGNFPTAPS